MAKKPKQPVITKKHLARQEREKMQTRYIIIVGLIVLILVIGLVGYGILDETYFKSHKTVATVEGEKIILKDFQSQVRFYRMQIINQAASYYQLVQMFGNDPQTQAQLASQLMQYKSQLTPSVLSENVMNAMVDDLLIRQEAKRRGITVTEEELEKALQETFQYYANGTPTSAPTSVILPTSTLNPTQLALIPPTATPTNTPEITTTVTVTASEVITQTPTPSLVPSITPTMQPTATSTPYTLEGYKTQFDTIMKDLNENIGFSEQDFRKYIESQLYAEKLKEAVLAEMNISRQEEQIWARHILVADEQTAKDILARLEKGEDWSALAAEFSTDTSNKDRGGDLGWFGRGTMVAEFEEAAFSLTTIGEISQPVKTTYGYHIIQLLGREMRQLSDAEYEQLQEEKFQEWMTQLKEKSNIVFQEIPAEDIPTEPEFPEEISNFITNTLSQ